MTEQDITAALGEARAGNREAAEALLAVVYERLRTLAEEKLRRERPGHTLQPTALVHEAYLKLVDQSRVEWQGRTHFFAVGAQAMRRILIDHARAKNREKRGGEWRKVTLHDAYALTKDHDLELLALNDALEAMRKLDERAAQAAELRIFGGLGSEEVARMLDISARTVERDWKWAQSWLRRELGGRETT